MLKIFSRLLILIVLAACSGEEEVEGATATAYGGSSQSYWPQAVFPMTIKTSTAFTSTQRDLIQDMTDEWEAAAGVDFYNTNLTTSNPNHPKLSSYYDGEFGIYLTTIQTEDLPSMALAVTQIYGYNRVKNGVSYIEIVHADIVVNDFNYNFSTSNVPGTYDLPTVILHELGHFLGMYHYVGAEDSVMYPSISSSTVNRNLFSVDQLKISDKYTGGKNPASNRTPRRPDEVEDRLIMELRADGECIHKLNGQIVERHPATIKLNQ